MGELWGGTEGKNRRENENLLTRQPHGIDRGEQLLRLLMLAYVPSV